MKRFVLGLLGVFALTAHARAQSADDKSPLLAVSLSAGATAAGAVAAIAGNDGLRVAGIGAMFVGPNIGRWYAGDGSVAGLGLRALGGATALVGLALDGQRECDDLAPCSGRLSGEAGTLIAAGATMWVIATVYDIADAADAARRWNAKHAVTVTPSAFAPGSAPATGLAINGRF